MLANVNLICNYLQNICEIESVQLTLCTVGPYKHFFMVKVNNVRLVLTFTVTYHECMTKKDQAMLTSVLVHGARFIESQLKW